MRALRWFLLITLLLSYACSPAVDTVATAGAQTQVFGRDMATALAGTMTARAPTATRTSPPPTATVTPPPSPTPSGKFEFFDVDIKQTDANQLVVTLGFQIQKDIRLDGLMIGAVPEFCGVGRTVSFSPYVLTDKPSGLIAGEDAIRVSLYKPSKCEVERLTVYVFRNNGPRLYAQTYDAGYTMEMK